MRDTKTNRDLYKTNTIPEICGQGMYGSFESKTGTFFNYGPSLPAYKSGQIWFKPMTNPPTRPTKLETYLEIYIISASGGLRKHFIGTVDLSHVRRFSTNSTNALSTRVAPPFVNLYKPLFKRRRNPRSINAQPHPHTQRRRKRIRNSDFIHLYPSSSLLLPFISCGFLVISVKVGAYL